MRKMFFAMRLFFAMRTQTRCLLRRRGWRVMGMVGILATLGCFWFSYRHMEAPGLMEQTVYGQVVLTLDFLMISIELRRESRREHLDDLFAAYSPSAALFPCAQLLTVWLFAAGITLLLCAGFAAPMLLDGVHILWLRQVLLQTVLLYFLPCFCFGAVGLLISHLIPGKNVYLAAVALWLPTSSVAVYFMGDLARLSFIPGWRLFSEFVSMGLGDYRYPWNFVSGPPIETPRWVVRSTLCLLAAALYVLCYRKDSLSHRRAVRHAKLGIGAAALLGTAMLTVLCVRYQVFFTQFSNDSLTSILTFEKYQEYYISGEQAAEKNITIQKTDVSLSCTTQGLKAEVALTAKADSLIEQQAFTLFSDLTVDEVLVDGVPAEWERAHDSLTVQFPAPKTADEVLCLTFRYHGYGLPVFPVNETTVQLGRTFPWLPWPGVRERSQEESSYNQNEVFCVADWQQGDPVAYTLRYDGPGGLCTNLSNVGGGRYEGVSTDGVMLYSGMVHSRHGGIDVYVPPHLYEESGIFAEAVQSSRTLILDLCRRMDVSEQPEEPASIVVLRAQEPNWGGEPNELFPRGAWWEIHLTNGSTVAYYWERAADENAFLTSAQSMADIAVPYLLSSCAGYPKDIPWFSTQAFAQLLRFSFLAPEWDEERLANRVKSFQESFFDWNEERRRWAEEEYGVAIPAEPDDTARQLDEILRQMRAGESAGLPFRTIYQRLLQGEAVLPAEMIRVLYEEMGDMTDGH